MFGIATQKAMTINIKTSNILWFLSIWNNLYQNWWQQREIFLSDTSRKIYFDTTWILLKGEHLVTIKLWYRQNDTDYLWGNTKISTILGHTCLELQYKSTKQLIIKPLICDESKVYKAIYITTDINGERYFFPTLQEKSILPQLGYFSGPNI